MIVQPVLPSTILEAGDRFEVFLSADGRNLTLPESFLDLTPSIDQLLDPQGRLLSCQWSADPSLLTLATPLSLTQPRGASLWLEYEASGRFRLVQEQEQLPDVAPDQLTETGVRLNAERRGSNPGCSPAPRQHATLVQFDLARHAAQLSTNAGFDHLICLPLVRDMELLEHQIRTAKTVLAAERFRGKGVAGDEVGPGQDHRGGPDLCRNARLRGLIRSGPGYWIAAVADRAMAGRACGVSFSPGADQPR